MATKAKGEDSDANLRSGEVGQGMPKPPASVRCAARDENGDECRAGIDAGSTWCLEDQMKDRWTTVGRRHYCPAHKAQADEQAEFEARADVALDGLMARAKKLVTS